MSRGLRVAYCPKLLDLAVLRNVALAPWGCQRVPFGNGELLSGHSDSASSPGGRRVVLMSGASGWWAVPGAEERGSWLMRGGRRVPGGWELGSSAPVGRPLGHRSGHGPEIGHVMRSWRDSAKGVDRLAPAWYSNANGRRSRGRRCFPHGATVNPGPDSQAESSAADLSPSGPI